VEKGIITDIFQQPCCGSTVMVEGATGVIVYGNLNLGHVQVVGQRISRGDTLGSVDSRGKRLYIGLYDAGYRSRPSPWTTWEDKPRELMDPTPWLREAWTRVTSRFHRDGMPVPMDVGPRKQLMHELQSHPIWHYPVLVQTPPSGNIEDHWKEPDNPDLRDEGFKQLCEPGPDWIETMEDYGGGMSECLCYDFVYVDPTLERIVGNQGWDKDCRNTDFRVWIEGGGWDDQSKCDYGIAPEGGWTEYNKWISCHDTDLDCGAHTMEDALLELAVRVIWYYGTDGKEHRPDVPEKCGGDFDPNDKSKWVNHCMDAGDGFCSKCGYLIQDRISAEDE